MYVYCRASHLEFAPRRQLACSLGMLTLEGAVVNQKQKTQ